MAFNIKRDETHALAREVASLAGESMAQAVDTALRERRTRLGRRGVAERLIAISDAAARELPPDAKLDTDDLYDDRGLPE